MVLRRLPVLTFTRQTAPRLVLDSLSDWLRPFRLIPLDEPLFLWYSSFWVQLQPIPGPRLCPSTLARFAKCAQFWCNISPLDATLMDPSYVLQRKDLRNT